MMPAMQELIGYCAAAFTTLSFVPQAWLTFRTRDVRGISLGMYSVFTCGVALWLLYGVLMGAWPIVVGQCGDAGPGQRHPRHETAYR
jgi:MtN3 and saliva related transmembrane protein